MIAESMTKDFLDLFLAVSCQTYASPWSQVDWYGVKFDSIATDSESSHLGFRYACNLRCQLDVFNFGEIYPFVGTREYKLWYDIALRQVST